MNDQLKQLLQKLCVPAKIYQEHQSVFVTAFTHRSLVNEHSNKNHNERLEFLGDAVLELVVTNFLFHYLPSKNEGEMTALRSALVKKEHLAKVARNLDLGSLLRLSRGEEKSGGREKDYLLANLMEALIGAIYVTAGFDLTRDMIEKWITPAISEIIKNRAHIDAKSEFQEKSQEQWGITPHYRVLEDSGLDHAKVFLVGAFIDDKKIGEGSGGSKKEAEIAAATQVLLDTKLWEKS